MAFSNATGIVRLSQVPTKPVGARAWVMSLMVEVFYESPSDPQSKATISERVGQFGGRLTYREESDRPGVGPVCMTYGSLFQELWRHVSNVPVNWLF
jgi:hypothetical protein